MILSQNQVHRTLNRLKARLDSNAFLRQYSYEQMLRSELFSTDQLEQHAMALAERHEVDPMPCKDLLLPRLEFSEGIPSEFATSCSHSSTDCRSKEGW